MKVFKLPEKPLALIFDIDSTLYTNAPYAYEQVDVQLRHFASLRKESIENIRKIVSDYKKEWAFSHNGEVLSLGNTLKAFGIPIEESIKWRKELLEPAAFLSEDKKLQTVLGHLSKKYKMLCVTNNPVLPAEKTLEAIGVRRFFLEIIGLDTCSVSKPAREPFLLAAKKAQVEIKSCISIGDRYDIDLALPLELGMGAILVDGVDDVYSLESILL